MIASKGLCVTDGEKAIINAIHPITSLRCWNHVIKNIEQWVKRHDGRKHDWVFYKSELKQLFKQESKNQYIELYNIKSENWDDAFKDYYVEHIHSVVDSFGRWTLEQYGLYCPISGLTTNVSEGFNNLFNLLLDHKEVDIDVAVLCFNQLQIYFHNEIIRGFANEGNYSLKKEYLRLKTSYENEELRQVVSPEQMADYIKANLTKLMSSPSVPSLAESEQPIEFEIDSMNQISSEVSLPHPKSSNEIRAKWLFENNKVELSSKSQCFNVRNEKNEIHVVCLNPKESCSCPERKGCAHILAAKLSIGKIIDIFILIIF